MKHEILRNLRNIKTEDQTSHERAVKILGIELI